MKKRDGELLDNANMKRVIEALEQEKPITKKAACEMLNITYNTTRLGKLIEEYKNRIAFTKKMRAKMRGKPLTAADKLEIAENYLNHVAVSDICESIFRSTTVVKRAIKELNIPERDASHTYQNPPLLEEDSVKEEYVKDDLVFSARYSCPALVDGRKDSPDGPIYDIYLLGNEQCQAIQPYWELADLTYIQKELNIKIKPKPGLVPAYNPR